MHFVILYAIFYSLKLGSVGVEPSFVQVRYTGRKKLSSRGTHTFGQQNLWEPVPSSQDFSPGLPLRCHFQEVKEGTTILFEPSGGESAKVGGPGWKTFCPIHPDLEDFTFPLGFLEQRKRHVFLAGSVD